MELASLTSRRIHGLKGGAGVLPIGGVAAVAEAPVELVFAFDVEAGLVSESGAARYGVVMKNGRADAKATAELRARMARERGPVALFDRGFKDIAELKSRCKAETGLEAPAAPQFQTRLRAGRRAAAGGAGGVVRERRA